MTDHEKQYIIIHRRLTLISMTLGIGIGLALGVVMNNIVSGLAIGVLLGGTGSLWQTRKVVVVSDEINGAKQ